MDGTCSTRTSRRTCLLTAPCALHDSKHIPRFLATCLAHTHMCTCVHAPRSRSHTHTCARAHTRSLTHIAPVMMRADVPWGHSQGMNSRIGNHIEFPNYEVEELVEIGSVMCRDLEYTMDEYAKDAFRQYIAKRMTLPFFSNARTVRNPRDRDRDRASRCVDPAHGKAVDAASPDSRPLLTAPLVTSERLAHSLRPWHVRAAGSQRDRSRAHVRGSAHLQRKDVPRLRRLGLR